MSLRKITSLTALLSFAALIFTSVFTYLAPRGPGSSRWEVLGLGKHEWFALHTDLGILFLAAAVVHTILNIKPLLSYLRNKQKKMRVLTPSFAVALLLTLWVVTGSLLEWAPFSAVQSFKTARNSRARHHPEAAETQQNAMPDKPPLFYSGRSLERLCGKYGIASDLTVRELDTIGVKARADWSIRQIAETNDMESISVYEAIRQLQD